jgi:outer membrane protein assembly factor BamB
MIEKMRYIFSAALCFLVCVLLASGCHCFVGYTEEKYPVETGSFPLTEAWSFQTSNDIIAIAVSDNYVIIGTGGRNGDLYRIDFNSRTEVWHQRLTGESQNMQLIISDQSVFVSYANSLFALEVTDGRLLWTVFDMNTLVDKLVTFSNSHIFVEKVSENITAYDRNSGSIDWTIPIGRGHVSLFYEDDTDLVYKFQGSWIAAIDDETGVITREKYYESIDYVVYENGKMYYSIDDDAIRNILFAYDLERDTLLWEIPLDSAIKGIYPIMDSLVIVTAYSLAVVNYQVGEITWEIMVYPDFYSAPAILGSFIYIRNTTANELLAIRFEDGKVLGSLDFGWSDGLFLMTPQPGVQSDLQETLLVSYRNNIFFLDDSH